MAETLEDGELWLPSDIFPPDDLPPLLPTRPIPSRSPSSAHLCLQFGTLNVVDHHPPPPKKLGGKRPMAECAVTAPSPNGSYALPLGPSVDHSIPNFARPGAGPGPRPRPKPGLPTPPRPPLTFGQACPLVTGPDMVTGKSRRSNRTMHGQSFNTIVPFQTNGLGVDSSPRGFRSSIPGTGVFNSSARGCLISTTGTGVFIPRATTASLSVTPSFNGATWRPSGAWRSGRMSGEGEEYYEISTSSEMGLPKDWTY